VSLSTKNRAIWICAASNGLAGVEQFSGCSLGNNVGIFAYRITRSQLTFRPRGSRNFRTLVGGRGPGILRLLGVALCFYPPALLAATNTFLFSYPDRSSLLAAGWNYIATTASGTNRNTEITNVTTGGVVSYDQVAHPGSLRVPVDVGDLYTTRNNSRNSLFQNLASNWVSLRFQSSLVPTQNYQQVNLVLYQDDDNYVSIGHNFSGAEGVIFAREFDSYFLLLGSTAVTATNLWLRLDRNLTNDNITGMSSGDGTNWITLGQVSQALFNPRVCVWAGGAAVPWTNGGLTADFRRVDILTSDNYVPVPPRLEVQPPMLVFSATAGQARTTLQQINVVLDRDEDPSAHWTLTNQVPWLLTSTNQGDTPSSCNLSVDTTGLGPGIYQGTFGLGAPGATSAVGNVTLIVNPACRVSLAPWRGARSGAMSVTVDDSLGTAFDILTNNGLTGTYYGMGLTPPLFYSSYYQAGMELGSHTADHPCYALLSEPMMRYEIEANLAGLCAGTTQPSSDFISFAWPCGFTTPKMEAVTSEYFLSARGYNFNLLEETSPQDYMNLKSFNGHEHVPYPPADLKTVVDAAIAQGKWFNLVLHGLTNDDGAIAYSATKDIWVAPIGSVIKYIQQRDRTVITNYTETAQTVSFDCYRLPLPVTPKRSFENAVHTNDLLTFVVDLTGIPSAVAVAVNSVPLVFTNNLQNTNLVVFDLAVTQDMQHVVLSLGSNAEPELVIQSVAVTNGTPTVTWTSVSNSTYRVQFKTNLWELEWQDLTPNITATGPTTSVTDPAFVSQRFYRILQLQ